MPANTPELEKRLWSAADDLRANSKLKSQEYSGPVLGLIFLRYADHKFNLAKTRLTTQSTGRRTIGKPDYQAQGAPAVQQILEWNSHPARRPCCPEILPASRAIPAITG